MNIIIVNSISLRNHLSSSNWGLFIYSYISSSNNYNFILYSSITYSEQSTNTNQYATVYLLYGLIRIISTNSSNNRCYKYSSFYLWATNHELKGINITNNNSFFFHNLNIITNISIIYILFLILLIYYFYFLITKL
jgi:hypothetical protein